MDRTLAEWYRVLDARPGIPDDERARRRTASADLVAAARPHLEWASAALAAGPHVVFLTDRDGVGLEVVGTAPSGADRAGAAAPVLDPTGTVVGAVGIATAAAADDAGRAVLAGHLAFAVGQELAHRGRAAAADSARRSTATASCPGTPATSSCSSARPTAGSSRPTPPPSPPTATTTPSCSDCPLPTCATRTPSPRSAGRWPRPTGPG